MKWPEFFTRHRYTVFALVILILVGGLYARQNLDVTLFPDTAPPTVNVITSYPGATAEDVSREVVEPLEEEFATLEDVNRVKSTAQNALSVIRVEFDYGVDIDMAAVEAQNAVSRAAEKLPEGLPDSRVLKFSTSDRPVITYGLTSQEMGLEKVRSLAENEIKARLQLVEGVAAVDIFGGPERQVNVFLERDRLEALGISPARVVESIRSQNLTDSAGTIHYGDRDYTVRINEEYASPEEIGGTIITASEDAIIRVSDVARVEEAGKDPTGAFNVDGEDAVALYVIKKEDANTVNVVDAVQSQVEGIEREFPGLDFTVADDDSEFTRQVVSGMTGSIGYALLLTALIILLFIVSFSQSLVVALSMPLTFLSTLGLMLAFGQELNLITMSALILSIGIVVDNSIVVVENISRQRREMGKDYYHAAVDGTAEIMLPVVAGASTTVVVLLPLLFQEGFVGRIFGPLATTLIIAVSSSLFIALTVIPLFTVLLRERTWPAGEKFFARATAPFSRGMNSLKEFYLRALDRALNRRALTLALTLILLLAGVRLLGAMGMEMLPRQDAGTFFVSLQTPPGTSLMDTAAVAGNVEELLQEESEVISYNTRLGYELGSSYLGESGVLGTNQAFITVTLTSRKEREESIWDIQSRLRRQMAMIPGIETSVIKETGSTAIATTEAPIDVRISGGDPEVLNHLAGRVTAAVGDVPGAVNLYKSWSLNSPEVEVNIVGERAMELGLSPADITGQVFTGMEGVNASRLQNDDVDIQVRYDEQHRQVLEDLGEMRLSSPLGVQVPLKQVAELETRSGADLVTRENLQRTVDVLGHTQIRPFSHVMGEMEERLEEVPVLDGYTITIAGEQADLAASRQDLLSALAAAVIGVYLILMIQFRSFLHPVTIMLSIPLVLAGVAAALLIAGKPVSMPVLLGLILLAGTVVNNSILLIDQIIKERENGLCSREAVKRAVSARYRPIMMTALSDVAGMLPLALELSLGSERFSPLAVAVIGGILASTLLTMVVIPVVYTLLEGLTGQAGTSLQQGEASGAWD